MFARLQSWLRRQAPTDSGAVAAPKADPPPERDSDASTDGFRETIEQIVIAFILAFVFRTFAAEPFVIPTGSMAPTLYGRHKEYDCRECGYHNVIGVSDEIMKNSSLLISSQRVETGICQNCGAGNDVREELAFTGDRILVTKYPYEIGEPDRFDVFVFKCPEEPITNFIKRLVGLPGETIRIEGGDLYRRRDDGKYEMLRKDPETQRLIQITVYDDQHPPQRLIEAGWPERWAAMEPGTGPGGWSEASEGFEHDAQSRTFELNVAANDWQWIRYRHYQSRFENWLALEDWLENKEGEPFTEQMRLIGDFCGYNASSTGAGAAGVDWGKYWVGDLTVTFRVDVTSVDEESSLQLELVEGVNRYRCYIDLKSGKARLVSVNKQNNPEEELPEDEVLLGEAQTELMGEGEHDVSFANVDNRLCLWIDGDLIDFGDKASYEANLNTDNDTPTYTDQTPVGIAARGAKLSISQLLLERDIYYRASLGMHVNYAYPQSAGPSQVSPETVMRDWDHLRQFVDGEVDHGPPFTTAEMRVINAELSEVLTNSSRCESALTDLMTRPEAWYSEYASVDDQNRRVVGELEIQLGPEHYLALGDNSPRSGDSRYWGPQDRSVSRHLLVGKAFWIYWPHGVPFMNDGRGYSIWNHRQRDGNGNIVVSEDYPKYTFPFYPNFWRMRLIH